MDEAQLIAWSNRARDEREGESFLALPFAPQHFRGHNPDAKFSRSHQAQHIASALRPPSAG
jgi:hypothetical protein